MNTIAAPAPRLIPRLVPGIAAVILGGVLVAATVARLNNFAAAPAAPPTIASAALTFTDLADGGVAVQNAVTGQPVAIIPARNDGFLRMTLRMLAGARERQHIGQGQAFILSEYAGGRMKLSDPSTGLSIELEAFGPSNVGEYAHLLAPESAA